MDGEVGVKPPLNRIQAGGRCASPHRMYGDRRRSPGRCSVGGSAAGERSWARPPQVGRRVAITHPCAERGHGGAWRRGRDLGELDLQPVRKHRHPSGHPHVLVLPRVRTRLRVRGHALDRPHRAPGVRPPRDRSRSRDWGGGARAMRGASQARGARRARCPPLGGLACDRRPWVRGPVPSNPSDRRRWVP
jgi:hypothetical protein